MQYQHENLGRKFLGSVAEVVSIATLFTIPTSWHIASRG